MGSIRYYLAKKKFDVHLNLFRHCLSNGSHQTVNKSKSCSKKQKKIN